MLDATFFTYGIEGLQLGLFESSVVQHLLEIGSGAFTFVLFALTLYAWSRRDRQPTLLLVSFAFLAFFVKQVLELTPISVESAEFVSSMLDFVTLSLFFVALVVRPRRNERRFGSPKYTGWPPKTDDPDV